jgi:hypothetical protein
MIRRGAWILLFALLFILARLALVGWSEAIYEHEEAKTAAIALVMLDGPKLSLMEYQAGDYEGGALLLGLLAVPFVALFKLPYLALKMLGLTLSLLLMLVSMRWIRKVTGEAGSWYTGALFLFAVPAVVQITFIPLGNWTITALFSATTFLLFHTIVFEKKATPVRLFAIGLCFGLGTWAHYGYLVTVFVCLGFWIAAGRPRFSLKSSFAGIAGSLVGFFPWLLYNFTHQFWGMERIAEGLPSSREGAVLLHFFQRMFSLAVEDLPCAFHLNGSSALTTLWLSYGYYFVFMAMIGSFLFLHGRKVQSRRREGARWSDEPAELLAPLVPPVYMAAFALVYGLSAYTLHGTAWGDLDPESHVHIFQLLPAMIWTAGVAAGKLFERRPSNASMLVTVLCVFAGIGQVHLLDFGDGPVKHLARPVSKDVIYMEIGEKWGRAPDRLASIANPLDPSEKRHFYFGAGVRLGMRNPEKPEVAVQACRSQEDVQFRPYCLLGIGTGLVSRGRFLPEGVEKALENADPDVGPYLVAGGAIGAVWYDQPNHSLVKQVGSYDYWVLTPAPEKEPFFQFIYPMIHPK